MTNGFTFGGIHSDTFGLIVNSKSVPLTPPISNRLQSISGVDGSWDYGISYDPREIELECTIFDDSDNTMKQNIRNLVGVMNPAKGAQPLIFDDEPDIQYFARVSNQIPLTQLGSMGTFTLQLTCPDPFTYAVDERTATFSSSTGIEHEGTHISKPILTVTHSGGTGAITNERPDGEIDTINFTESALEGTYIIDSKAYTVTQDGVQAYNAINGNYIKLVNGTNQLTASGAVSTVELSFRDTWL